MTERKQITGTLAEVEAVIAEEDAASGYPRKGRKEGPGPHAKIQKEWDGTGETPPGWEKTWAKPERHPKTAGVYAAPLRDAAHRKRLLGKSVAGRTIRAADVVDRDATWRVKVEDEPVRVRR